jgi:hypothetical protein
VVRLIVDEHNRGSWKSPIGSGSGSSSGSGAALLAAGCGAFSGFWLH